jgi:hypothetical protein
MTASAAMAAVTFDPATGTGFVGKGDVQLAFGWNNKTLQESAASVTFSLSTSESVDYVCEWTTGNKNPTTHRQTKNSTSTVTSAVNGDPRQGSKQFTGFNLTGFGAVTADGELPAVGDFCPSEQGAGKTVVSVGTPEVVSALSVSSGGITKAL